MKQGIAFSELTERVDQDTMTRRDYYVPSSQLRLSSNTSHSSLETPLGRFAVNDLAHAHLAGLCGVTPKYYAKMREQAPDLLDQNVNHWLERNAPRQRILRTRDWERIPGGIFESDPRDGMALCGEVRAIVSNRFGLLDNDALLKAVEPIIDGWDLNVESCDLSEESMILKMVSPRLKGEVAVGDEVQGGLVIRNSEVGCNVVEISFFVKRLVCLNGLVVADTQQAARRRHLGRTWSLGGNAGRRNADSGDSHNGDSNNSYINNGHSTNGYSTNGSCVADDVSINGNDEKALVWGEVPDSQERTLWEQDVWCRLQQSVQQNFDDSAFDRLLERLQRATRMSASLPPEALVERVTRLVHLHESEQQQIIAHLASEGDPSLWGLVNAVTRASQDIDDYARATTLEEMGGVLVNLTPQQLDRLTSPN